MSMPAAKSPGKQAASESHRPERMAAANRLAIVPHSCSKRSTIDQRAEHNA